MFHINSHSDISTEIIFFSVEEQAYSVILVMSKPPQVKGSMSEAEYSGDRNVTFDHFNHFNYTHVQY